MRVDKQYPNQDYNGFWDWLLTSWHPVWIVALVFGYAYYLVTMVEV